MERKLHARRLTCLAAIAGLISPALAMADVSSFGNFSNFTINVGDSGAAPTVSISAGEITLLNGVSEKRSIFANAQQNISRFNASFTFQSTNTDSGACFVIQNNASGASTVGGFNDGFSGIGNSVAISLDNNDSTSLFTNGNTPNPPGFDGTSVGSINLFSGDPIKVGIAYSGSLLTENLSDAVTSASFSTSYIVNIGSIVGSTDAYVGLTGASGIFNSNNQSFSNFQFTSSVPEPGSLSGLVIGAAILSRRRRREASTSYRRKG